MFRFLYLSSVVAPAWADWDPSDSHETHYPQIPDTNGWYVHCDAYSSSFDFYLTYRYPDYKKSWRERRILLL